MDIAQTPHELGAQGRSQVQQDVVLDSFGRHIFLKQFLAVAAIKKKKKRITAPKWCHWEKLGKAYKDFYACESIISVKFQFKKESQVLHRNQYGMSGESNLTKIWKVAQHPKGRNIPQVIVVFKN